MTTGSYTTYVWFPGGQTVQTINNNMPGVYSLNVIDQNGCAGYSVPRTINIRSLPADLNIDVTVNTSDYLRLISVFGESCICPSDINQDGTVNTTDVLLFFACQSTMSIINQDRPKNIG